MRNQECLQQRQPTRSVDRSVRTDVSPARWTRGSKPALEVSAIATKQTISEGGVAEDLCAPDVVSPAQFHEMWSGTPDRAAEFKLALAVLGQAIEDLERHHGADAPEHQRLYSLARRWVSSNDRHWPYSFVNVCDILNLSCGRIRTKLLEARLARRRLVAPHVADEPFDGENTPEEYLQRVVRA